MFLIQACCMVTCWIRGKADAVWIMALTSLCGYPLVLCLFLSSLCLNTQQTGQRTNNMKRVHVSHVVLVAQCFDNMFACRKGINRNTKLGFPQTVTLPAVFLYGLLAVCWMRQSCLLHGMLCAGAVSQGDGCLAVFMTACSSAERVSEGGYASLCYSSLITSRAPRKLSAARALSSVGF